MKFRSYFQILLIYHNYTLKNGDNTKLRSQQDSKLWKTAISVDQI